MDQPLPRYEGQPLPMTPEKQAPVTQQLPANVKEAPTQSRVEEGLTQQVQSVEIPAAPTVEIPNIAPETEAQQQEHRALDIEKAAQDGKVGLAEAIFAGEEPTDQ